MPVDAHVCYAQQPPAGIELDHQSWYCLTSEHRACVFYHEPSAPAAAPVPVGMQDTEDEIGPPPPRLSALRVILWVVAILAVLAVGYYYGSTLLAPVATVTPVVSIEPSLSPEPSVAVTPSPDGVQTPTQAAFSFADPTATPTPYPGGAIYGLVPAEGAAGWVASDETRGNHFGDSYLYTGVFDGIIYHGAFQFDLSSVPRGATIHWAVLELTGLDARRLGSTGTWEVRILGPDSDADWNRKTYQDLHNAAVQWTLPPALGVGDLVVGETRAFELSQEQTRDLGQRLLAEHYTLSFRLDGPLAGESSVFAWDSGAGAASRGKPPRLLLSVGEPPRTPIPTGSPPPSSTPTPTTTPTPTETPDWVVVTNTPTPENVLTAAVVVARETVWATTTGTATATPQFVATASPTPPSYVVVTNTPTPASFATAVYWQALATAHAILTGTPTPTPPTLVTATSTPRPTRTPVVVWLDQVTGTPTPTPTPVPTIPPIPSQLRGSILFLSDRGGTPAVYVLDPDSGRVGLLTDSWPYDMAKREESVAPDGQARAFVQKDGRGVPQIYIYSDYYGGEWQVTFNTGLNYDPVWSPLGEQLAFVSTEGGNDDIYVVDIDGQEQKRLTLNQWEWDKHPSWSPDATQIIFWSNAGTGRRQLWIMDADGRGRRILHESAYNDWDPVWIK